MSRISNIHRSEMTPRMRANERASDALSERFRAGRLHHKCPFCDGDGDGGDFCLPCEGTGIAASATFWDR